MKSFKPYNIYLLVYSLLCFAVPFENVIRIVPNILIIVLAVLSPFVINKNDFKTLKKEFVFKWGVIFFGYLILSSIFNQTINEDIFVLKKIAFILPILFFSIPIKQVKFPLLLFNLGVFTIISISFYNILIFYLENRSFDFFKGEIINSVLLVERLYLGFLGTISFVIGIFIYKSISYKPIKFFYLFNAILSAVFLIVVSSRMAVISILVVSLIKVTHVFKLKKVVLITIVLGLIIAMLFKVSPNLKSRFFYPENDEYSYFHKLKEWEPRYVIWKCSYNISQQDYYNKIIGMGFRNLKSELINCYEKDIHKKGRRDWFLKKKYNSHNQFIDLFLSTGIFGFLIFCALLVHLIRNHNKDLLKLNLLIILILFSLIENFFHRQIGVYLFAFIIAYVNFKDKQLKIEK